jgi:DNA-binding response OmpR family regulator
MANILVIDDAALVRKRIKNILIYDNHQVFEMEDGNSFKNNTFPEEFSLDDIEIVFLDIYLKNENGFDILRYLTKYYPDIDVIIVSGENKISTVAKAVEYGAKDFLAKPFDNKMLLKKLGKIIDKRDSDEIKNSSIIDFNSELTSFNTYLNLELNRSLRSQLSVSFLKVDFNKIDNNHTIIEIKNDITASIRDIDQIYLVDYKKICFLLPLTGTEGRKIFRKKIKRIISKEENEESLKEIKINDITFPEDIIEGKENNLDFSKQNYYKNKILNKLAIKVDS